jgi:3-methylfumaryl-CoA hydratase
LLRRQIPDVQLTAFEFKALAPLVDIHRFTVCGKPEGSRSFALWARDHRGALAMRARAEIV